MYLSFVLQNQNTQLTAVVVTGHLIVMDREDTKLQLSQLLGAKRRLLRGFGGDEARPKLADDLIATSVSRLPPLFLQSVILLK